MNFTKPVLNLNSSAGFGERNWPTGPVSRSAALAQKPKVVVGTLTWNQKERVFRWFESISKLDYPGLTLVVVDNHSTDGTVEALRQSFPEAHVIRHRENLGFCEGINSQFRFAIEAGADYLFIVENDGEPDPKVLSLLVEACG